VGWRKRGGEGGLVAFEDYGIVKTYVQRLSVERFQVISGSFNTTAVIVRRTILAMQAL
jgi:hypothetical protein